MKTGRCVRQLLRGGQEYPARADVGQVVAPRDADRKQLRRDVARLRRMRP